jgi:hypothetical protein
MFPNKKNPHFCTKKQKHAPTLSPNTGMHYSELVFKNKNSWIRIGKFKRLNWKFKGLKNILMRWMVVVITFEARWSNV